MATVTSITSITSINGNFNPLSKIVRGNIGSEDVIEPLEVNQDFLDKLNSQKTREDQEKLFKDILVNGTIFQGEVFQICCAMNLNTDVNIEKIRFGRDFATHGFSLPPDRFVKAEKS